jgi:hypothetical protein
MADAGDVERMQRIINRTRSYGIQVVEMPNWQSRGATWDRVPSYIIDHHDASTIKAGEWGSLGLIVSNNLSQFQVARCLDGVPKIAVCCAGRAGHAGLGGPLAGMPLNNANAYAYGAEKANNGLGEPYTDAANYATDGLFRACAIECGRDPAGFVYGHKEWAPLRKIDPVYSMQWRRGRVVAFQATGVEDDMDWSTRYTHRRTGYTTEFENWIGETNVAANAAAAIAARVEAKLDALAGKLSDDESVLLAAIRADAEETDVRALAEALAPLLPSDTDPTAFAEAVADALARRLAE